MCKQFLAPLPPPDLQNVPILGQPRIPPTSLKRVAAPRLPRLTVFIPTRPSHSCTLPARPPLARSLVRGCSVEGPLRPQPPGAAHGPPRHRRPRRLHLVVVCLVGGGAVEGPRAGRLMPRWPRPHHRLRAPVLEVGLHLGGVVEAGVVGLVGVLRPNAAVWHVLYGGVRRCGGETGSGGYSSRTSGPVPVRR